MEPATTGHEAVDHNELPVPPGKPESRHPRAQGNHGGAAMGPRTRRLPDRGVTAIANEFS